VPAACGGKKPPEGPTTGLVSVVAPVPGTGVKDGFEEKKLRVFSILPPFLSGDTGGGGENWGAR